MSTLLFITPFKWNQMHHQINLLFYLILFLNFNSNKLYLVILFKIVSSEMLLLNPWSFRINPLMVMMKLVAWAIKWYTYRDLVHNVNSQTSLCNLKEAVDLFLFSIFMAKWYESMMLMNLNTQIHKIQYIQISPPSLHLINFNKLFDIFINL